MGVPLLFMQSTVGFQQLLAMLFVMGVSIIGILTVARWAASQLKTNADMGSQSESASLLLQEYEQRGVGWLWQVDSENRVGYISSRMGALIGRPSTQILGHSLPALLGAHTDLGRVLLDKQPFTNLEMELRTARGNRWISLSGDPIIDTAGRFEGFRGVGLDITDVRHTQERLTHLANVDVLSGLPNRGRVRQLLGEALRGATAGNVPCAIMFLDLDGFKPVNDTFGHPKGDAVLQAVAKRLCDEVAADGHVGRLGGDEFAIVIPDAQSRRKVEQLADRIIMAIAEPYSIDGTEIRIGVSVGCAFGPIDGATVDDLILKADLALYQAKDAGRGVVRYFSSELQSEQEDRVRLEADMRAALENRQFYLNFQPLVSAKNQKLVGFEALVRWNHPRRGFVPPNVFIPVAEECGLMGPLGEFIIEEACRAAASWPAPITVALNVSPKQIILPNLPNVVSQALARHKLAGQPDRAGSHRRRVPRQLEPQPRHPRPPPRAWRRDRARRLRHRLFLDRLSEQGRLPQAEDRRQLRPRCGHPPGQRRDHQVDRPARQGFPHVGHRRRRRNRRGFRADAPARLRHHPGLSVRQAAVLRPRQPAGHGPRRPQARELTRPIEGPVT